MGPDWPGLVVAGCAKHADFLEIRDQMSLITRTQDQEQKRFEAIQRRLESLERVREPEGGNCGSMMPWHGFKNSRGVWPKLKRRKSLRLPPSARISHLRKPTVRPVRQNRQVPLKLPPLCWCSVDYADLGLQPGVTTISMESSIWRSAASSISSRDFPIPSLTPNALLVGRVVLRTKDYIRAMQSFEHVVNEYAGNEKVPSALFARPVGG